MKAKEFYEALKEPIEKAGDSDIEFWLGETMLDIESMGQFGVVPDITIHFKETT